MGLLNILTCPLLLLGQLAPQTAAQILYHIHHGDTKTGLHCYLDSIDETKEHDYTLLQQAGINLLEQGASSADVEIQMMCLLGAGVSLSPALLPILEKGIQSDNMQAQLAALNFLSMLEDDEADLIFLKALSSPFLLTRMEACFNLSKKNNPVVLEHLQSLIIKVPEPLRALFPQIVVNLDNNSANQMMRQLLSDGDLITRCEAIIAAAKAHRDDFLPQIRILASQAQVIQQECAAMALGELQDRSAIHILQKLTSSRQKSVRLAACYALYQLGDKSALPIIDAEGDDLYAVVLRGKIPTEDFKNQLVESIRFGDRDARLNATLALLEMRDERCLPYLQELIVSEKKDIGYIRSGSPGGAIQFLKTVISASCKQQIYPAVLNESAAMREQVLLKTLDFNEDAFIDMAQAIFDNDIRSLIPITLELLTNHRSAKTMALLHDQQQNILSSEFVRTYCNLALYKLGEEGPYEDNLVAWVKQRQNTMMIRFHEEKSQDRESKFSLNPEEQSRLLIEVFETLAQAQNHAGINALVHAIADGHTHNRYALAGLLIRTTE